MSREKDTTIPQTAEAATPLQRFQVECSRMGIAWKVVDTGVMDERWPPQPKIVQWFQSEGPARTYAEKLNAEQEGTPNATD